MTIHLPPPPAFPRHRRAGCAFHDLLGAAALDVLAPMDAPGDDVRNQTAGHRVELEAVGVRRRNVIVSVEDPFGDDEAVNAICNVDIAASVPATRRGVHLVSHRSDRRRERHSDARQSPGISPATRGDGLRTHSTAERR
jgi:hypothetical protein